jgi:two-component system, OmpR family, sensor histidine kinase KdpD
VHVISHAEGTEDHQLALPQTRRPATLPRRRVAIALALAAVGPPLLTVLLAQFRGDVGLPSVLLLFLLLVVAVSAVGGLWPALAAAVNGFLLVNWYFTPPLYTFTIGEGENVLALVVFLAVAVIVSGFVALAARRAAEAAQTQAQAEALARLAGSSPVSAVLESLSRVLRLDGAAVLHREEGGWRVEAMSGDNVPESPEAASATINLDDEHLLAIVGPPVHSSDERVLDAFAKELAASVELDELEEQVEAAGAAAAANELRAAILSAVSNDLRTPISAIKAAVTRLLREDLGWTPEARRGFLDTIHEEADRLDVILTNLLDMSRLQAGSLEIDVAPVSLEEVLPAALASAGISDGAVELDLPATLPRVLADGKLLERALANVIENAARYSPAEKSARVTAGAAGPVVDVRVVDRGPGMPRDARERLFRPFRRLGSSGDEEVGLGLAVAKGFVEAMGGEIEAEDTPGGGLTVVTRLPTANEATAASRRSS